MNYYVLVLRSDGAYFVHGMYDLLDDAVFQRKAAALLYGLPENDRNVPIVKIVNWKEENDNATEA